MTAETRMDNPRDQFPVGMRVLAVDGDPICLMLLETLLRRCQYHVTTASQAITALKMLRENKNKFDLLISDVNMPDMDGFKLLEHVGLEMDLPVIMLSAHGDTKLVMKSLIYGACDYLLKPVRIEELKNIWQHVIRRKKFDSKEQNNTSNQDKSSRVYENLSSASSQNSKFSVSLLDHGRCSYNWPSVLQSSRIQTNSYPSNECFRHAAVTPSDNINVGNSCSSSSINSPEFHDSMIDLHSQGAIFANATGQISSRVPFHGWDDNNQNVTYHSNAICSSVNSMNPVNGTVGPSGHAPPNSAFGRYLGFNFGHALQIKQDDVAISTKEAPYIMDQHKGQQG